MKSSELIYRNYSVKSKFFIVLAVLLSVLSLFVVNGIAVKMCLWILACYYVYEFWYAHNKSVAIQSVMQNGLHLQQVQAI